MSILNITGFETGNNLEFPSSTGTFSFDTTIKRTGNYSLRVNPTTTNIGYVIVGYFTPATGVRATFSSATIYYRFYFYATTLPSADSEEIAVCLDNSMGLGKMFLRITSAGHLQVYSSNGTSQMGSDGATTLVTGTWYRIEMYCTTGSGSVNYEVKIDGVSELAGAGALGTWNNGSLALGKRVNRNGESVDFYYDDVQVNTSAYPGAGSIFRLDPDGDGTYTTWTIGAGAGADWQNVDEVPMDSNTTYLLSTMVDNEASTVTLESCSDVGLSGTITVVHSMYYCIRNAATTPAVKFRLRSNTTDSDTATATTPTGIYACFGVIYETDPATSIAWTTGGVDATEIGVVEKSTSQKTRWSAGYLMVEYVPSVAAATGQVILWKRKGV